MLFAQLVRHAAARHQLYEITVMRGRSPRLDSLPVVVFDCSAMRPCAVAAGERLGGARSAGSILKHSCWGGEHVSGLLSVQSIRFPKGSSCLFLQRMSFDAARRVRRCGVEDYKRGADSWRARAKTSAALRDEFADLLAPDGAAERSAGAAEHALDTDPGTGGGGVGALPALGGSAAGAGETMGKVGRKEGRTGGEGDAPLPAAAADATAAHRLKGKKTRKKSGAAEQRTGAGQGALGSGVLAPGLAQPKHKKEKRAKAATQRMAPEVPCGDEAAHPGTPVAGGGTDAVMALLGVLPLCTLVRGGLWWRVAACWVPGCHFSETDKF